jgi:hypothetical protein
MIAERRVERKGGFSALSSFPGICCACFFITLVSCSGTFRIQENLVKDLFDAARNHDVSKAVALMPRMSSLSPDQQKLALDDLSRIGRYAITDSRKEGDAVIVTLQYHQGNEVVSLGIPVRREGESWVIGDDFRVRRSLEGRTIDRSN